MSSLGDILQSIPAAKALSIDGFTVDWVIEERCKELLQDRPFVETIHSIDTKNPKNIRQFLSRLRDVRYDVIYDLQGNCKSALMASLARGKKRIGYTFKNAPEWPSSLFLNERVPLDLERSMVEQYFQLVGKSAKALPTEVRSGEVADWMICPGSNWENKRLSKEQWKSLIEILPGKSLIIWKTHAERELAESLGDARGNLSLSQWQNLMLGVRGVITVDSCALHLAAIAGVPTLSFFGPSSDRAYAPIGELHHQIRGACPYGVSFLKRCPKLRTCSTGACLKELTCENLRAALGVWSSKLQMASKSK